MVTKKVTQSEIVKAIERMPIIINRQGVRRGSDLNGWYNAQQAAIKAVKRVFARTPPRKDGEE